MLTLTTSGSGSDYLDNEKSSLQQKVANAAGVDTSLVTIRVAAASVLITASIAVPASKTADQVQNSLSTNDASDALGVTVEEVPTITVEVITSDSSDSNLFSSDSNVPLIAAGIAVGVLFLVFLLSAGACFMVRRQQKQNKPGRVEKPGPEAGYQYQAGDKAARSRRESRIGVRHSRTETSLLRARPSRAPSRICLEDVRGAREAHVLRKLRTLTPGAIQHNALAPIQLYIMPLKSTHR